MSRSQAVTPYSIRVKDDSFSPSFLSVATSTLTASSILSSQFIVAPTLANLTLPTAAQIVAAHHAPEVGTTIKLHIGMGDAGAALTITGAAGITLYGDPNSSSNGLGLNLHIVITNPTVGAEAVEVYFS